MSKKRKRRTDIVRTTTIAAIMHEQEKGDKGGEGD
jgi:hypothetical protein